MKPDQASPFDASVTRRICLLPPLVGLGMLSISEHSWAGAQIEEPLIDSVRTALSSAVRKTLQQGMRTGDIAEAGMQKIGCAAMGDAVVKGL